MLTHLCRRPLSIAMAAGLLLAAHTTPTSACTSVSYVDANGKVYFGRTLELQSELPYQLAFVPAGAQITSQTEGHEALSYTTKYSIFGVVMPARMPTAEEPLGMADLKLLEGMNNQGLTFSLLAYPSVQGPQHVAEKTQAVLSAIDFGSWALGQFSQVDDIKKALAEQSVLLDPLAMLGGAMPPIHFVLHDRSGDAIVVEWHQGEMTVYDNPVGVMTNGPQFSWHLTNLNNYTFLSNIDQSAGQFGGLEVKQPDSGIATAALPASNTSVGRFVRAAYYAQFAEKVDDPDAAVHTISHIVNNFDRPKGITIDKSGGGEGDAIARLGPDQSGHAYTSEYTSWTSLQDLQRGLFFIRSYDALNYTMFDINQLATHETPLIIPLHAIKGTVEDGTAALLKTAEKK